MAVDSDVGETSPDPSRDPEATYHFLDMGRDKYGDCIIARFGDRAIMVDGGHPKDLHGQAGVPSIPEQLETIFAHPPPFDFSLIVVTHCHNDHIGCLPELIAEGLVRPRFAIVSDPDHGFPPGARDDLPAALALPPLERDALRQAMAGLAEEDHSDLSEADLAVFLDKAVKLGPRYRAMIATLEQRAIPVVRWGVSPVERLVPIYDALKGTGFDVIAPSIGQLTRCRDQISDYAQDSLDQLVGALQAPGMADSGLESLGVPDIANRLYRGLSNGQDGPIVMLDRKGQGSALNCQSIMLKLGNGASKVLLTGDMQFADPEVDGIDEDMSHLLAQAIAAGPYRVLKLPHHTSYNGVDVAVWEKLGRPDILVHSGGSNDVSHPEPSMLEAWRRQDAAIVFARTDRNGLITVRPARAGSSALTVARGELDNFSPNQPRPRDLGKPSAQTSAASPSELAQSVEITFVKLPFSSGSIRIDGHEIEIRRDGREPEAGIAVRAARKVSAVARGDVPDRLAGGRKLPSLLFVTDRTRLASNIGESEAKAALDLIERDAELLVVASVDPQSDVRKRLGTGRYDGVVLVGGYDVLPSERVDVLDARLRGSIARSAIKRDQDEFVVWSDDLWGDVDADGLAELPVSRIPDGRSSRLVARALVAGGPGPRDAFGLRNVARDFAIGVFAGVGGARGTPLYSAPTHCSDFAAEELQRANLYFMLHGDDRDASRFWGDDPATGNVVEAVNVSCIPASGVDIVFAGCCWGALTVLQRANRKEAVAPRSPEASMALSCLLGGARAFVGCTGVHYSPDATGSFFGGPMHHAFWSEVAAGQTPAVALFAARKTFLADMPHGRHSALEQAIERKIWKQFTCLGLGW